MEIFLLIFFLIIIIEFILFIFVLSEIELDISNSDLSYVEKSLNKLNFKKFNLAIKISFLGKFLIFACFIDENNINFWKLKFKHRFSGKLEGDILKGIAKIKRLTDKYEKNCINYLKPKIDNLDIYAAIGMPEHMMTVTALPVISTYLSFKLRDYINKYKIEKCNYEVIPRYLNKLYFKAILNCNIKVRIVNLFIFLFVSKVKK